MVEGDGQGTLLPGMRLWIAVARPQTGLHPHPAQEQQRVALLVQVDVAEGSGGSDGCACNRPLNHLARQQRRRGSPAWALNLNLQLAQKELCSGQLVTSGCEGYGPLGIGIRTVAIVSVALLILDPSPLALVAERTRTPAAKQSIVTRTGGFGVSTCAGANLH